MFLTKRGESLVESTLAYVILFALFMAIMFGFIYTQENNVLLKGQYYAYQISQAIDSGKARDVLTLDIQKLSETAYSNGVKEINSIITFDSINQLVYIKISDKVSVEYPYFMNFNIKDVQYGVGNAGNTITFTLEEANE